MSLAMRLGARGNLLTSGPGHARQLELPSPILDEAGLRALCDSDLGVAQVSTAYDVTSGPWGLREAVERLNASAVAAVRGGAEILVLSDRPGTLAPEASHVPPLLAVGAVHRRLLREGLRCRASLVVDAAQCWSVHHFACLIGYGASAVSPHLAFETVRHLHAEGRLGDVADAERNYRVSAERGLFKILSKMGISRLSSYHGAQLFEAMGVGPDLLDLGFAGTPSRIGGLSVEELAQETVWIHQQAFPELSMEKLHDFGFVRFRRGGEYHLNNPEVGEDPAARLRAGERRALRGVLRDPLEAAVHRAARPCPARERPRAAAPRRGGAGGRHRAPLLHRRDVAGRPLKGSARSAGHRDEPYRRQVQLGGGRRGSGARRPAGARGRRRGVGTLPRAARPAARRRRRLAHQASGLRPFRGHAGVPRHGRTAGDQDRPGRQARGGRRTARREGDRRHRRAAPRPARAHADLAAAAPRHLLDRGPRAAGLRPEAGQSGGEHRRQARCRDGASGRSPPGSPRRTPT